jgi:hypothetical protein
MTVTLDDVVKKKQAEQSAEEKTAIELIRLAQEQGLSLTGPDGLLKQLTKTVLETALNEELTEHLGYEKHDPAGAGTGNIRNGIRSKTVLTEHSGQSPSTCPAIGPQHSHRRSSSGVDVATYLVTALDVEASTSLVHRHPPRYRQPPAVASSIREMSTPWRRLQRARRRRRGRQGRARGCGRPLRR